MERFYHFRVIQDGKPLSRGGVTFVIRELAPGKYGYNFSVCSLKDNYNKKKGRLISKGRLDKGAENYCIFTRDDKTLYMMITKTVSFIRATHLKKIPNEVLRTMKT